MQEKSPSSEYEFLDLLQVNSILRTSAPTTQNGQSSRSHVVSRIRAVNKLDDDKPDSELFLIYLAGSEGSQDSKNRSHERLAESSDTSTSLSLLEDCIRGRTLLGLQQIQPTAPSKKKIHIPWRSSKLT